MKGLKRLFWEVIDPTKALRAYRYMKDFRKELRTDRKVLDPQKP